MSQLIEIHFIFQKMFNDVTLVGANEVKIEKSSINREIGMGFHTFDHRIMLAPI